MPPVASISPLRDSRRRARTHASRADRADGRRCRSFTDVVPSRQSARRPAPGAGLARIGSALRGASNRVERRRWPPPTPFAAAHPAHRRAARLLRRRRPRDPIVELAIEQLRRAGLCPPRDRPQQVRRRQRSRRKGAIFVEELDEVPDGAPVVFSAHGVPKSVPAEAARARPRLSRRDLPAGLARSTARPSGWSRAAATSCSSAMPATPR